MIRILGTVGRTVVTHKAADLRSAEQFFGAERRGQSPGRKGPRQDGTSIVQPVAWLTLGEIAFRRVLVVADPRCTYRVHPVGAAVVRRRRGPVAAGALGDRPDVSLKRETLDVIVLVRRRILGVRGAVTRGALQAAMACREPVERTPRGGHVVLRRKCLIDRRARLAVREERGRVADLPVVGRRRAGMAVLARRFVQPARTG